MCIFKLRVLKYRSLYRFDQQPSSAVTLYITADFFLSHAFILTSVQLGDNKYLPSLALERGRSQGLYIIILLYLAVAESGFQLLLYFHNFYLITSISEFPCVNYIHFFTLLNLYIVPPCLVIFVCRCVHVFIFKYSSFSCFSKAVVMHGD